LVIVPGAAQPARSKMQLINIEIIVFFIFGPLSKTLFSRVIFDIFLIKYRFGGGSINSNELARQGNIGHEFMIR
jgi:hypothetical protein